MSRLYIGGSFPFGHSIGWLLLMIFLIVGWASGWDFEKLRWRWYAMLALALYLIMR